LKEGRTYGAEHFEGAPTGLRAGDRVEALVRARLSRNFLDPGAFDERGYLARQKIDLTGSLRSGELLQLIGRPRFKRSPPLMGMLAPPASTCSRSTS
jgi:Domain of unknown function (DUF4131)